MNSVWSNTFARLKTWLPVTKNDIRSRRKKPGNRLLTSIPSPIPFFFYFFLPPAAFTSTVSAAAERERAGSWGGDLPSGPRPGPGGLPQQDGPEASGQPGAGRQQDGEAQRALQRRSALRRHHGRRGAGWATRGHAQQDNHLHGFELTPVPIFFNFFLSYPQKLLSMVEATPPPPQQRRRNAYMFGCVVGNAAICWTTRKKRWWRPRRRWPSRPSLWREATASAEVRAPRLNDKRHDKTCECVFQGQRGQILTSHEDAFHLSVVLQNKSSFLQMRQIRLFIPDAAAAAEQITGWACSRKHTWGI